MPHRPDTRHRHALTHEGRVHSAIREEVCLRGKGRSDRLVSELASRQEGVVDLDELRDLGMSEHSVSRRVRKGWLHPVYHRVYAVGHPSLSLHGRFVAATKACGRGAALSHRAAAARESLIEWRERNIDVTIPRGRYCRFEGIQVHRSSVITRNDSALRDGALVTKPTWTLVALAGVSPRGEVKRATSRALADKVTSIPTLVRMLDRVGPARGSRVMRDILARGAVPTRSVLEDVVYDLIIAGGFEEPDVNKPLHLEGRIIIPDFRWAEQQVIVEADGARWHDDPIARADDLERQRLLERSGETVLRVRWDEALLRASSARRRFASAGAPLASREGKVPRA